MSAYTVVKNKKKKWVIILVLAIAIPVLIVASFAAYLILSFKPGGEFEGMWDGGMRINDIKKDAKGEYKDIKDKAVGIIIDIDEQSAGYGHIRIRNEESKPIGDEVFPCLFKDGRLTVKEETLELDAKQGVDHGTAYMDGEFTLKKPESGIVLIGTLSVRKTVSKPNVFDFGMSIPPPLETFISDAGMTSKLDPDGKAVGYVEGYYPDNRQLIAYVALRNMGDKAEVVFKWKSVEVDREIYTEKVELTDAVYTASRLDREKQPVAPGHYVVDIYINGQAEPMYGISFEVYGNTREQYTSTASKYLPREGFKYIYTSMDASGKEAGVDILVFINKDGQLSTVQTNPDKSVEIDFFIEKPDGIYLKKANREEEYLWLPNEVLKGSKWVSGDYQYEVVETEYSFDSGTVSVNGALVIRQLHNKNETSQLIYLAPGIGRADSTLESQYEVNDLLLMVIVPLSEEDRTYIDRALADVKGGTNG